MQPEARAGHPRKTVSARFAWGVLGYNVLVIAWGAFVRATGSGAGCGKHWPLCNGEVVPRPKSVATLIEVSHRITSGIAALLVLGLVIAALVRLPRGHRSRAGAVWSGVFILGEVVIGAGLVLFELVAHDASMKRALSMILHLSNTFLLLGALVLTAWWLSPRSEAREATGGAATHVGSATGDGPPRARHGALLTTLLYGGLGMFLFLGASGAIAALGDTLFPSRSLHEGLSSDLSPMAHAFLRLRVFHPLIALFTGILVLTGANAAKLLRPAPIVVRLAKIVTACFVAQFCAGLLNVVLLAPVWMQLVHLSLADATWVAFVLVCWETLRGDGRFAVRIAPRAVGDSNEAPDPSPKGSFG